MKQAKSDLVYCTYFDSGYLSRGLSLLTSLRSLGDASPFLILALDQQVFEYFQTNEYLNVECILLDDLIDFEPRLSKLQSDRTRMEFVFTCTPILIKFAQNKLTTELGVTAYLDADLFYFSNPAGVVNEMLDSSVGIIPHRYPSNLREKLLKYGTYNVGWVGFRNDSAGNKVLTWYGDKTIEWCGDHPDDGRYADQGYLDEFPRFKRVKIIEAPEYNLAPWNTSNTFIEEKDGVTFCNGAPLSFFHFHGISRSKNHFFTSQLVYRSRLTSTLKRNVYVPYVRELTSQEETLVSKGFIPAPVIARGRGLRGLVFRLLKRVLRGASILTGNSVAISTLKNNKGK